MIPADRIKWIIENIKPEGFGINNPCNSNELFSVSIPMNTYIMYPKNDIFMHSPFYPLFLQRVIEGVNKKYETWKKDNFFEIRYNNDNYYILDGANDDIVYFYFEDFENIDQAKEQAILYTVDKIIGEG